MALSIVPSAGAVITPALLAREPVDYTNDVFSFWKLPENYRAQLEAATQACEPLIRRYLFEEYLAPGKRTPSATVMTYYRVKKFIPQMARHWINYAAVRARLRDVFPNWPCETALVDIRHQWLRESREAIGQADPWHIAFWPSGKGCCISLTHDVESPLGFVRMERMADLEERYGFRSSWNLPLAQYAIDWKVVERLRARGFEFGAHGLAHDGRMFRSRHDFEICKMLLERLAGEHNLRGFRGPSTLRNAEWIGTMSFAYDSTFSDTDPYEPQPGGTCSLFPFFLSDTVVELPYTLPQDHTMLHLVRRGPLSTWATKAHWIRSLGGMILPLTHPDYSGDAENLPAYEELLKMLAEFDAWRALPLEVAQWWRERAQLKLTLKDGKPSIEGPAAKRAVARRFSEESFAG